MEILPEVNILYLIADSLCSRRPYWGYIHCHIFKLPENQLQVRAYCPAGTTDTVSKNFKMAKSCQ